MGIVIPQAGRRSVWCSLQKCSPINLSHMCLPASQGGTCYSSRISTFINYLFSYFYLVAKGIYWFRNKTTTNPLPHPQAQACRLSDELMKISKHLQPLRRTLCWSSFELNHPGWVCGCYGIQCTPRLERPIEIGTGGSRLDWLLGGWSTPCVAE